MIQEISCNNNGWCKGMKINQKTAPYLTGTRELTEYSRRGEHFESGESAQGTVTGLSAMEESVRP